MGEGDRGIGAGCGLRMLAGLRELVAVDVVGQSTCSGTDFVVDVAGDDRGSQAFQLVSLY